MREERSGMSEDGDGAGEEEDGSALCLGGGGVGSAKSRGGAGGCTEADRPPPFSDQVLENVLENVLQFLVSHRDRNAVSLVCRSWYRAEAHTRRELFIGNCYAVSPRRAIDRFSHVRSLVLKGKPRFADFNLVPIGWGAHFSPWVSAMAPAYPWLERVCLKRVSVADDDLSLLAFSFPFFKDLTLICCDGFSTAGLAVVTERCRHLRVLDLIEDYLDEEEDEVVDWISKFPQMMTCLETLGFDCVGSAINFEALEALVARSPVLRRLRVNHHVTVDQLRRLMVRAPQLTHVGTGSFGPPALLAQQGGEVEHEADLVSAFVASRSIVSLSGFRDVEPQYLPAIYPVCANLTSLNFSFAEITADELKPVICHCHNLQNFWVVATPYLSTPDSIPFIFHICSSPSSGCYSQVLDTVCDEGLHAVAATCKDLRELRVFPLDATEDSVGFVSDVGLTAISEGCRKLRSFLYFCQRMTNKAVITMSKNCQELVVFRLCIMGRHLPDYLTGEPMDDGFGAIVMNCNKLTRLAISGLLTDKAFEYIGKYGKSIRTLSVAFAGNSDRGLTYVLEGCSKLQKLEIRDSPFGDPALLSGIHHYYNMRFLWMSSCELSMRGCNDVAQSLPHLVIEVISDQPEADDEAVEKLYMYRSLAGPRNDAPPFVKIL